MLRSPLELEPVFGPQDAIRAITVADDPQEFLSELLFRREWLDETLQQHGGLLIRGLGVDTPDKLSEVIQQAGFEPMSYLRGTTPRSRLSKDIYTSTEAIRILPIPLHNEMSYTSPVPRVLAFACQQPAGHGGATPVADMGAVYRDIPITIRQEFEARGVRYTQYVNAKPRLFRKRYWSAMFDTTDPARVEEICASQGVEVTWQKDNSLRLQNVRPATLVHPTTGETIWFNQAHIFHHTFWSHLLRARRVGAALAMRAYVGFNRLLRREGKYPFEATFGDGGEIPKRVMEEVRNVLDHHTKRFTWQRGDLLLLDNLRIAHARDPYRGARSILASLANPTDVNA